ncbi:MAG: hypothetical protein QM762_07860 [Chryseolinea sp.]
MKLPILVLSLMLILISCYDEDVNPRADKVKLLSGNNANGKQWQMTSFQTISNYCSTDRKQLQTIEACDGFPESIKDNVTTFYPDGSVVVSEGKIKYHEDSPQTYVDKQFWTLNQKQDSVAITDYIGLPSLNTTWHIDVSKNAITLTRFELNSAFEGSSFKMSVVFKSLDNCDAQPGE